LQATGQQPEHLVLEITESRLMRDSRATLDILARLRLKGVNLSIDDFGTGHSSLTQLHFLPFNELKIDRGFVHHAWLDPTTRAIYDASLGVARQLGIESVAEVKEIHQTAVRAALLPVSQSIAPFGRMGAELQRVLEPHVDSARALGELAKKVKLTVLVVDDDDFMCALLARMLAGAGYETMVAHSGAEVFAALRVVRPDLIVIDVLMPGMNGIDITRRLKATPALSEIPLIIVTGNSESATVKASLKAGAIDFVVKPVEREMFLRKVAHALQAVVS
jgi:CheY-like chemotaxis protein